MLVADMDDSQPSPGRLVLDSSCWLEVLNKGGRAEVYAPQVRNVQQLIVPAITVFEVHKVLLRTKGLDVANSVAMYMRNAHVIDLDAELAASASELSVAHNLPMADSLIYATALAQKAVLWTQDAHFVDLPGVRYFSKH